MKKCVNKIVIFILGVLFILTPFLSLFIYGENQINIYSETYYAALVDKVNLLEKHKNDKKIILIGGSNVAFGFDSKLIEEEFPEYKVINFGLYAALGTKLMVDLSKNYINENDMVFVIPEISSQSMSLYFNPMNTLKAIEEKKEIFSYLEEENKKQVFYSYFDFIFERGKYSEKIVSSGVYQRKNFNSYGDIYYTEKDGDNQLLRSMNRMGNLHHDPSMLIDFSFEIDFKFIEYLNDFYEFVCSKNANVYYAFCPVNDLATTKQDEELEKECVDFYWKIKKTLKMDVIGNPLEYLMDSHYFYDSNFHLNDSGAIARTYLFIQDIYREIFMNTNRPKFDLPEKPDYPKVSVEGEDSLTVGCFNYKDNGDSYSIVNIKEEFMQLPEIVVPIVKDKKPIIGIEKEAFKNSNLEKIVIPSLGINTYFSNGAFDCCSNLKEIYLEEMNPGNINVSYTGELFSENTSENLKIYVPRDSLELYKSDYFWSVYSNKLEAYDL